MKSKQEYLRKFIGLLDMVYRDVTNPDSRFATMPFGYDIPALLAPMHLEGILNKKNIHLSRIGIEQYTTRFHPLLVDLFDAFDNHKLSKNSYPQGKVIPQFRENLRLLDELGEGQQDFNQYVLFHNIGQRKMILINKLNPSPAINIEIYKSKKKTEFNVRMKVFIDNSNSRIIDKNCIIPFRYGWRDRLGTVDLLGYRISDNDEWMKQHIKRHEGKWRNYRIYTDSDLIWKTMHFSF